jgi:hypothetical protein
MRARRRSRRAGEDDSSRASALQTDYEALKKSRISAQKASDSSING